MFLAQCPHCKTIFQTDFSVLGPHGGQVACGECRRPFNAFDHPYLPPDPAPESIEIAPIPIVPPTVARPPVALVPDSDTAAPSRDRQTTSPETSGEEETSRNVASPSPTVDISNRMSASTWASSSFDSTDSASPFGDGSPSTAKSSDVNPFDKDPPHSSQVTAADLVHAADSKSVEPTDSGVAPSNPPLKNHDDAASRSVAPNATSGEDAEIDDLLSLLRPTTQSPPHETAAQPAPVADGQERSDLLASSSPDLSMETFAAFSSEPIRAESPPLMHQLAASGAKSRRTKLMILLSLVLLLFLFGQIAFFFRDSLAAFFAGL